MIDKKYVVFKPSRYGGVFAENYWTGDFTEADNPAQTSKVRNAKLFKTSREAYDFAGEYKKLNWWQVGERRVGQSQL